MWVHADPSYITRVISISFPSDSSFLSRIPSLSLCSTRSACYLYDLRQRHHIPLFSFPHNNSYLTFSSFNIMSSISSTANISNLSEILRRANEHYAQVAIDVRSSLRPTHHAWKRARRLNLHVNVCMARNLDPSSVSQIPPAVLENTPPPAATALYPLPGREREIRNRLSVRSDIPRDVQMYEEDDYSSVSTTYSNVSLTPPSMPARKVYAVWRSSSSSSTSSSSSASSGGPVTPVRLPRRFHSSFFTYTVVFSSLTTRSVACQLASSASPSMKGI